jgi:exopolysaccharide biosynthesis polyprenyl glycosylphosphotransferase
MYMAGMTKERSASRSALAERSSHGFATDFAVATETEAPSHSRVVSGPHGLPVRIAYAAIDCITVCLTGALVLYLQFGIVPSLEVIRPLAQHAYFTFTFLYAVIVLLSCASQDLYRTPRDRGVSEETFMVVRAVSVATIVLVLFVFVLGLQGVPRITILALAMPNAVVLSGWRYLKRRMILNRTLRGIGVSRVLIVGAGRAGRGLAECLKSNPQLGYQVCGFLEVEPSSDPKILGTIRDLRRMALEQFVDELFLTPPIDRDVVKQLALESRELRLALKVVPDLYDGLAWRAPVHAIGGYPVMELHGQPIREVGMAAKRIVDILIASIGLVLTAPLLAVLAALVRFDSPGPAFYSADRVGYKARRFRCWKLRTMSVDADLQKDALRESNGRKGPFFKIKNDPRVTRMGRWLRKFSLDELPQLWNVLCGDMSMVGPRPHPMDDFTRYSVEHLRRLDVKPGITGLWQVTARQDPSFETNLALDLEYIENWSPWLDLEILFRSVPEIFSGKGE